MPRIVDHEQRRAELAKAARAIVASEGIEALTIARVATATGYSSGVVNHYFANKRQMLLYTYTSTVEQLQSRLKAQLARSPRNLDACLKAFLPMNEEQQHEWLLWFAFWGMAITDQDLAMAQRQARCSRPASRHFPGNGPSRSAACWRRLRLSRPSLHRPHQWHCGAGRIRFTGMAAASSAKLRQAGFGSD